MEFKPIVFLVGLLLIFNMVEVSPYVVDSDYGVGEYGDKLDDSLTYDKRSCIKRGGSCDHRPNDCCYSSACRCNLWGTNCRCQRAGLFQRWGRK